MFALAWVAAWGAGCAGRRATAASPGGPALQARGAARPAARRAPASGARRSRGGSRKPAIPPGVTCLLRLQRLGVAHRSLRPHGQLLAPMRVLGPIGGISLKPLARRPMVCDCRLVLAIHRASAALRQLDVRELQFSSAYRPARAGRARISRHAMGLAIDVHAVVAAGRRLRVSKDYERGLADPCEAGRVPVLNRMACLLKSRGLFDRVLTPDTNRAHRDHFHLAILSLERRRNPARRRPHPVISE